MRLLLGTFGINFTEPMLICHDNQSAIRRVQNPDFTSDLSTWTSNITLYKIKFRIIKVIDLEYIPTSLQTANTLTNS